MKRITALLLIILTACIFCSCQINVPNVENYDDIESRVELIDDESYYEAYEVKGKGVNIYCTLTFKNKSDKDVDFYLSADFSDDKELGLVTEGLLYGVNKADGKDVVHIKANKKKTVEYIFKGIFAGVNKKANRLLPDIEIQEV